MKPFLLKILTFFFLISSQHLLSQEIWYESFSTPNKGVWGDNNSSEVLSDFSGITKWTLDFSKLVLENSDDYAKTVTTSGGRFECRDINAEAAWRSVTIDISAFTNISIALQANETGSGANENNKYIKAFYKIDNEEEKLFETNGENRGNWGNAEVQQTGLLGEKLQIIVYINNHYANDKVILDEIIVSGEEKNPVVIEPGDVLINEILFNPVPGGEDYLEVYNHSNKNIPLNKLHLASRDKEGELTQIYVLSEERLELEPQQYLALTKDTAAVFPWFTIKCPACFLQMPKFPSFNNDEDYAVLLNSDLLVIDELLYNERWHSPLLHNREGISLERASFSATTQNKENWHSASTEAGYGTPGYKNSQFENKNLEKISVSFAPEAFSPNNDSYNDIYTISFQLDHPGYLCNIWIFDSAGRRVRQLCKNNILGTNDTITWNGENESGQRLKLGAYIVLVEVFNTQGFVKQFKDGVVLTDILE